MSFNELFTINLHKITIYEILKQKIFGYNLFISEIIEGFVHK